MKIQGHLQDYPLPVLLEVLADRRESGCLRIAFEPEPAVLHFKEGQLVDAQFALLRGSAAINLALTMEQAPFDFDNEIILPHSVIDSQERAMLSRLLGMRLNVGDNGEPETRQAVTNSETESRPNLPKTQFADTPAAADLDVDSTIAAAECFTNSETPEHRSGECSSHLLQLRPVFSYLSRPNLIRIVVVLLIVALPAAVGLILRFSKKTVTAPANAASGQPRVAVDPTATPVLNGSTSSNSPPTAVVEPAKVKLTDPDDPLLTPSNETSMNQTSPKDPEPRKIVAESEPSKVISEVTKVKEEAGLIPDSPRTLSSVPESRLGPTTKTIVVEVRIEQGRVTGAWVKNSRKDLEAFEAAAVRIIRQRRYSKEFTGTDSVAVDVTINP